MRLKKFFFCIIVFANITFVFSEENAPSPKINEIKHIVSLDTGLILTALKNFGYGIGVHYEHKLNNFLSIKPGFGHMVCYSDVTVVTVNLQLFLNYYPLSNGLDKLYVGLGSGCDFYMYPTRDDMSEDKAISVTPVWGWKWKVLSFLMIEPFVGWKFYVTKTNNYDNVKNYLNDGFQYGINIKLFLQNN